MDNQQGHIENIEQIILGHVVIYKLKNNNAHFFGFLMDIKIVCVKV